MIVHDFDVINCKLKNTSNVEYLKSRARKRLENIMNISFYSLFSDFFQIEAAKFRFLEKYGYPD